MIRVVIGHCAVQVPCETIVAGDEAEHDMMLGLRIGLCAAVIVNAAGITRSVEQPPAGIMPAVKPVGCSTQRCGPMLTSAIWLTWRAVQYFERMKRQIEVVRDMVEVQK